MAPPPRKKRTASTNNLPKFEFSFDFVKKLVLGNLADAVAIVCTLLIAGSFYNFSSSFCTKFVVVQHNITNPDNLTSTDPMLYSAGVYDGLFVFFAAAFSFVLHDVFREILWERLYKQQKVQKFIQGKLQVHTSQILFSFIAFLIAAQTLIDTWENGSEFTFSGYPNPGMTTITKSVLLVSIGYWIYSLVMFYFLKNLKQSKNPKAEYDEVILSGLRAVTLEILYIFHFYKLAMVLIVVLYPAIIVRSVYIMANLLYTNKPQSKKNPNETLRKVATLSGTVSSLASLVAMAVAIIMTAYTFVVGLPAETRDSESPAAIADFNNGIIRGVSLAVVIGAQVAPLLVGKANFLSEKEE